MTSTKDLLVRNLPIIRESAGLTQLQVARKIGIAIGTYQQYEYGKRFPRPKILSKIAKTLGVTESDLFASAVREVKLDDATDREKRAIARLRQLNGRKMTDEEEFVFAYLLGEDDFPMPVQIMKAIGKNLDYQYLYMQAEVIEQAKYDQLKNRHSKVEEGIDEVIRRKLKRHSG